jgi:hypothetical protein
MRADATRNHDRDKNTRSEYSHGESNDAVERRAAAQIQPKLLYPNPSIPSDDQAKTTPRVRP